MAQQEDGPPREEGEEAHSAPERGTEKMYASPPGSTRLPERFSLEELLPYLWEAIEKNSAAIEKNNERIDAISASLRDVALRAPSPDVNKGLQALVLVCITISLASFAATVTTISLLISHVIHA